MMGCRSKNDEEGADSDLKEGILESCDSPCETGKEANEECDEEDRHDERGDYVPETEESTGADRFKWQSRKCLRDQLKSHQFSVWGALSAIPRDEESVFSLKGNKPDGWCAWDSLFAGEIDKIEQADDEGIDHLAHLLGELPTVPSTQDSVEGGENQELPPENPINLSMLSQEAQNLAGSMLKEVRDNRSTTMKLDAYCPQWKENIAYAFHQKKEGDVLKALEKVKRSKDAMEAERQKILEAWERQQVVLAVFEKALASSLHRLKSKQAPSPENGAESNAGFMTGMSRDREENGDKHDMSSVILSQSENEEELLSTAYKRLSDDVSEEGLQDTALLLSL